MLPSALRTLSVVTLLGAVSGTVFLVNDHQHPAELAGSLGGGTSLTSAALIPEAAPAAPAQAAPVAVVPVVAVVALADRAATPIPGSAPKVETAAYQMHLRNRADAKQEAKEKAAAERKVRAERKAAAERRAQAARARASRDATRDPRALARVLIADRGWGSGQFSCLNSLWNRESGWNYRASNPSSGAYGIPQSLPGSKMGSVASDWRTNPATQITWGLNYIADRYGTPCGAWGHSQSNGWY